MAAWVTVITAFEPACSVAAKEASSQARAAALRAVYSACASWYGPSDSSIQLLSLPGMFRAT